MSECDEGKGGGDSEQLLTNRLKTTEQEVFHCIARALKIELGESLLALNRLGKMAMVSGEGKGRGDGEQSIADRLRTIDPGVSTVRQSADNRCRRKLAR